MSFEQPKPVMQAPNAPPPPPMYGEAAKKKKSTQTQPSYLGNEAVVNSGGYGFGGKTLLGQ